MQAKWTLSISYSSDMYQGYGWLLEEIIHGPTCAHSSTQFSLLCVQFPMPSPLSFLSLFWFPTPSSFHLTDISSKLLYKIFSLRESSAYISTQVIVKKIWILEAISCRNKSHIVIIKITKLPCHLTIFVSLHAVYSKKGGKKELELLQSLLITWILLFHNAFVS